MTRAVSSNLKVKKSRKIIEDSDRESITSISDSEKSDYEEDECFTSSESEGEETPPPQKEKVKKEKSKTPQTQIKAKPKPEKRKHCNDKKTSTKRKRKAEMFDDSNVKIDMSVDSIKPQKIKLTSNLLIECRTITVDEPDKGSFPIQELFSSGK